MATIKGISVKVTYNGVELQQFFADNGVNVSEELDQMEVREFTANLRFVGLSVIGVRLPSRPAVRQSCLWRHSFDWRNRKRGHPVHREG